MRLSNIFETPGAEPSFDMRSKPAPKPASAPSSAAVSGANAMRGVTGQGGSAVAKALGTLGQGKTLTPNLLKALDPYADALTTILSEPQLRTKFAQLVKQAQAAEKKEPAEAAEASHQASTTMKHVKNPTKGEKDAAKDIKPGIAGYKDRIAMLKSAEKDGRLKEDQDSVDAVAGAITRRIMMQHTDLLSKYGPVKVMAAIDDVADFAGSDGLDEIGSSDVSIWTKQVIQDLESGHFDHMESTQEAVGDYTVKTVSAADAWKKHTGQKTSKSKVPVDPKTGKTLYQKITSEEVDEDKVDTVTMDIPLLLRMMEFAREDAQEDMDLHDVAERMIAMSKDGPLSMDDYDSIVGSVEALPAPEEKPMDEGYYAPGPETMPGAVGPQDNTTVSFNQSKQIGDATLNINASAKDMEELHRILKLAGVNYDSDGEKQEPSMQDVAVALEPHTPEAPAEEPCGCQDEEEPADVKYTTDKQTLINVLRNKLQKRLA